MCLKLMQHGHMPLYYARKYGKSTELVDLLLERGAKDTGENTTNAVMYIL